MPKRLTQLKIDEVSSVDAGAGEGVRVVLMKRAPVTGDELRDQLLRARDEGKLPGIDNTAPRRAAPRSPQTGRAMPRPAQHEDDLMDTFSSIVRDHGLAKVAKAIAAGTPGAVSEAEFTAEVTKYARRVYPDLRPDQAFAKVLSAGDERAQVLSKATRTLRDQQWLAKARKVPVDTDDKLDGVEDGDREDMQAYGERRGGGGLANHVGTKSSAYDALMAKAAALRASEPHLSAAQSFAKAYAKYPALAALERKQNRPTATK